MKRNEWKARILSVTASLTGDRVVSQLMVRRNFRYYKRAGIVFVHVPKAAGTSISHALYGRSLGHFTAQEMRSYDSPAYDRLRSFSVLRHPVERAYSAWRYASCGGTESGWIKPRPEYAAASFREFETFATEWLPERSPDQLDYVFRPQVEFVADGAGRLLVDSLIALPQLKHAWPSLIEGKRVSGSRLEQLNANGLGDRVSPEFDGDAAEALSEYYRADLDLYTSVLKGACADG